MPKRPRDAASHFRKAVRGIARAAVEVRVQKIRERSKVPGKIGVTEQDGLLVVAPETHHKDYMREELGDRETAPRRLWRKSLRHGNE